jgi:hypothetical protein
MNEDLSIIRAVPHGPMAIDQAMECYKKWKGAATFEQDLAHYLLHGVVVSRPSCFGLAKIIDLAEPGEEVMPAWFIRVAVGDLRELLGCLPGFLPAICFCRRGDGKLRAYSLTRLIKKVMRKGD